MTLATLLAEIDRRIAAFGADRDAYAARDEGKSALRVAAQVNALLSLRLWVDSRPAPTSRAKRQTVVTITFREQDWNFLLGTLILIAQRPKYVLPPDVRRRLQAFLRRPVGSHEHRAR